MSHQPCNSLWQLQRNFDHGEFLSVERRGKIAILTMIKPESMNAIGTHDDCQDIIDTLRILGDDRGVSAIVLTGSGKAFSAGGNLKGMQEDRKSTRLKSSH